MSENENEKTEELAKIEGRRQRMGWTTSELAEAVNVDPSRIRQFLLEGTISGIKFGRAWSISHSEAQRFIEWYEKNKGW
jgi:excisionase family DNA binding protein